MRYGKTPHSPECKQLAKCVEWYRLSEKHNLQNSPWGGGGSIGSSRSIPFGGIQIVLVGDFVQLPPVRNTRYSDAGDFCFQSLHFPVHVIFLKTVFRQDDQTFCDIIRKVSLGDIDEACENFIYDLSRPLPSANETTITRLFSQNIMTDMYNRDLILSMPGQLYSFESIDEGEEKYLNTMLAPKTLWLNENAKCILLRNLSDSLVNGLQGKVLKIREGSVDVYFPSLNEMTTLSRVNFTVFDPDSCRNLASRYQIPLKLSYAITVHKAQEMTLERVEVDCRNIFQPGQLGVAIGRVKSAERLRVINFTADVVIKQPLIVREFLLKDCKPAIQDLSCCHECVKQPEIENPASAFPDLSTPSIKAPENCDHDINIDDELDDEEIDEVIRQLDLSNVIIELPLPDDYNFIKEAKSLKFEEPQRENQKIHNSCIDYLLENNISLKEFLTSLYSRIGNMYEKAFIGDASVQKVRDQTTFFVEFQKFVSSTTYKNECLILFSGLNVCDHDVMFPLCYQILSALRELYIQKRAENLPTDEFCERFRKRSHDVNSTLTDSALGKIRYVAGYVVAKLRYHNMLKVQRSAFKTSKEHLLNYEHGKRCMTVLDSFKASEFSLLDSECQGSLKETKRKQNISRGLTNVTDDFYILFSEIVSEILSLFASRNVSSKGTQIFISLLNSHCLQISVFTRNTYLLQQNAKQLN